ncbi:aspartyl/asparaginyl beta-hydroxylase domain-containing protein [Sphingomonas sp. BIUV-7]|uniref:Aspartyl/asparaginyl beta-hydroxylase domain-containing protein n=1 Tax=Sphingomonas natans TaxID=3063330 RepID=A0ABT8Y4P8_9SPHN|nr:aspartyl/asparaginyl beta-hydroxylase domain-containing protein [Sphingomonas sp. BIUV-7]MDO6413296.1 aspartyl/asparaginyl beta-hydroxylase domain-containing protein [Sphingomonas sp. BIUV-7]
MKEDLQRMGEMGVAALGAGDAAQARRLFEQIEEEGRGSHQLRLLLAQACTMMGDAPAAHRALDQVLRDEPTNLYALLMRGDLVTKAGDPRAAVSWYQAALMQAPRAGQLPPDLLDALRDAERKIESVGRDFADHMERKFAEAGVSAGIHPRFAEALDLLTGKAEVQLQQPTNFYYPQLPQRAFFEREEFAWVADFEARAPLIRAELEAVLAADQGLQPYVAADPDRPAKPHPLLGDPRWSAFHFFRHGMPVAENAARCPQTFAALNALALPRIDGRSPMAMFSVLKPRTHIPPHNGMLNTRLICHLPLIVPDGCRLRVGNTIRAVEAGKMMIFDDSIRHEAWNDSAETRTVLIFEIWRPELTEAERAGLTTLFGAIDVYSGDGNGA